MNELLQEAPVEPAEQLSATASVGSTTGPVCGVVW